MFVNFLPFIVGRNLIETTLISHREIFGFSIFNVKYFFPIYVSDLFLLLIYQNYFSKKFFAKKSKNLNKDKVIESKYRIPLISLTLFFCLILIRSLSHELSYLLIFGSLIILKYILIFILTIILNFEKKQKIFAQLIASNLFFQSIIIFVEQFKGGNIGRFIENRLPGLEMGTRSAESASLLRADGTFNEPNITAIYLLINVVLLSNFAISLKKKNAKLSFFYFIIVLLSLIAIIFTGSRSLYALTLVYLIYLFFKHKQQVTKIINKLWKNTLLKTITISSLIMILPYFLGRMESIRNVFTDTGSLTYRTELNKTVLSMSYKELLGVGLDLTPYYLAKNYKTVDSLPVIFDQAPAHNIFVQVLAETGIFAFLLFVFFIYYAFKIGFNKKNKKFALAAFFYLLAAQFHPVFTNHYELTAFFFLYLGMGINETK
jgi:putative inorganic carbon (HCO3(-)) transporter